MNPLAPFLEQQAVLVLDGGLATQLELLGCDLNDPLWSAKVLLEQPELIQQVHEDYLRAGADCLITASYQATLEGFMRRGLDGETAVSLLQRAVHLAMAARDAVFQQNKRLKPLVAASIGPYAAFLADGSEYHGRYDLTESGLVNFHRERWHILTNTPADLMACETIPAFAEARALAQLLQETPERVAWFSFACRDGLHISDGTPLAVCATYLDAFPQVVAIGINCTAPRFIPSLIKELQRVTTKPIIVYPNSGEGWDAARKCWIGESVPAEFGALSHEWHQLGARIIGGCCRTTPAHIREIRNNP